MLDQFVCVRMVEIDEVDLALFDYDTDLSWSTMFMNADRVIYGRYGTRAGPNGYRDITLEGFKKAIEGALELHRAYPANRASLLGKAGPPPKWKTPRAIPQMRGKSAGCFHCHQIHEGEVRSLWSGRQPVPDSLLWKYPPPDSIGLAMDPRERAAVLSVAAASPAEKAGFQPGDRVLALDGQPVISVADLQWILFNAKETVRIRAEVDRGGQKVELGLALTPGWRRKGDFTKARSSWWLQLSLFGFLCEPLPDADRRAAGIPDRSLALRVGDVVGSMKLASLQVTQVSTAAQRAGLQKGDVIVAVDGKTAAMTPSEFIAHLLQKKGPGLTVGLTVRRGGKPQAIGLAFDRALPP